MTEIWYRAEVRSYATVNEWGDVDGRYKHVVWSQFEVERHTPKGVQLRGYGFVRGKAKRQLAVPTKELALKDALARKDRHIWGCEARLRSAREDKRKLEWELTSLSTAGPRT